MHTLYITLDDNQRLRRLLRATPLDAALRRDLHYLGAELDRACIVPDAAARPGAIRLGSRVEFLDLQSGEAGSHVLCLPDEVPALEHGLSVVSPLGAAVLGCSVGDEVRWDEFGVRRTGFVIQVEPPTIERVDPELAQSVETP